MSRIGSPTRLILLLSLLGSLTSNAFADDAFIVLNPSTGRTESVWSAVPLGGSSEVFFSVLQGSGWSPSEQITSNSLPDQQPQVALTSQGDRKLVWWRNDTVDVVLFAEKSASGGWWSTPVQVSDGQEDARSPQVAVFGATTFAAYEGVPTSGYRKVIVGKQDGPDPWPLTQVATSSQVSALYIQLHSDSGHLWVEWVDSAIQLGWSEYLSGSWGTAEYETYGGADDIASGRGRIRSRVLGR